MLKWILPLVSVDDDVTRSRSILVRARAACTHTICSLWCNKQPSVCSTGIATVYRWQQTFPFLCKGLASEIILWPCVLGAHLHVITPRACARGKVIGSVVVVVFVNKKITKSRHLGTLATHKHNKSVEFDEKLASLCFESSGMTYKHHK